MLNGILHHVHNFFIGMMIIHPYHVMSGDPDTSCLPLSVASTVQSALIDHSDEQLPVLKDYSSENTPLHLSYN